jgi:hypothetical protein
MMLGYSKDDLDNMIHGIECADLIIDSDKNPAIHNYLVTANEFLQGLWAEGYFD